MRRDIFRAIADPTRRAITTLIALQALTPNAIVEHFDSSRQAISKHWRILTECELVKQEKQGREIYCQLEIDKMKEIDKLLKYTDRFDDPSLPGEMITTVKLKEVSCGTELHIVQEGIRQLFRLKCATLAGRNHWKN